MPAAASKEPYGKLEVFSSQQWFSALDGFMEEAFRHILEKTNIMHDYISQLMLFQLENKKRRVSLKHKWRDAINAMAAFISSPSLDALRELSLDRGYSEAMLRDFAKRTKGYESAYEDYLRSPMIYGDAAERLAAMHKDVLMREGRDMLQCVLGVNEMLALATETRNMLIGNYLAYLAKTSKDSDLAQDYYLTANKAINHFNASKGTFKSYLDIWMKKTYMKQMTERLDETLTPPDEFADGDVEDPLEARILLESL